MSVKKSVFAATALFATNALSAYIAGEPWADLIPEGSYEGGLTDYGNTFGIAVVPLSPKFTPEHTVTVAKRDYITVAKRDATVSEGADGQLLTESAADVPAEGGVGQIEDGQVQYGARKPAKSNGAVGQITDGQVQAVKGCPSPSELESVLATATTQRDPNDPVNAYSYKYEGTLEMTLNDGVLRDARGRIGSIVASRQFQFDGPPPQAGSIYAKGWSLTPDGNLALGDSDVFYRCLSGNFYNLYDQSIGGQCSPVHLQAINLISC